MTMPEFIDAAEIAASTLDRHPDYRVLRRLQPPPVYHELPDDRTDTYIGLYLDCETTGLDTDTCEIIELAAVRFHFTRTGLILRTTAVFSGFEQPCAPIPAEITELTGITDDMVRGQHLPDAYVRALVHGVSLVVAHNAEFDRPVIERRFPGLFEPVRWGCSFRDVPWAKYGVVGGKLEHIAMMACGVFYEAHRALDDVHAGLHVLATAERQEAMALEDIPGAALNDGCTEGVRTIGAFAELLAAVREPAVRVFAWGSPFSAKDQLRARGYRWDAGKRVWWRDVPMADADAEVAWARAEAWVTPKTAIITAVDRFSTRAGR